jgi:formamidopyrimidine-DNA glycosylase
MLELPEAAVIATQSNKTLSGKKIRDVIAAFTPHKFAWFAVIQGYSNLLVGKTMAWRPTWWSGRNQSERRHVVW